jgi:hypothetical protein
MTPLALNSLVPQNLRLRIQVALSALPLACMLLALVPSLFFAQWLEKLEGIPAQTRLLDHPAGRMWVAAFLAALVLQLLCGYVLGWLLNAMWARWLLRWPADKIRAVYLHPTQLLGEYILIQLWQSVEFVRYCNRRSILRQWMGSPRTQTFVKMLGADCSARVTMSQRLPLVAEMKLWL